MRLEPDMRATAGPDGAATWICDRWCQFVGRPREQELGFGWLDHVHPDDLGIVATRVTACLLYRTTVMAQFRIRNRSGAFVLVRGVAHPQISEDGSVSGIETSLFLLREKGALT